MSKFDYTEEMVERIKEVLNDGVVDEGRIVSLVNEFEFPRRSVTAKLRKLGYDVPKKPAETPKFSEQETSDLRAYLEANAGVYTAEEIAKSFADGKFTARQINGKVLSLEMNKHVKPAEKKVVPKTYTVDEENVIKSMVASGKFIEDIAEKVGKSVNSVRGKLLSMELKAPQRDRKESKKDAYEGIVDLAPKMTVAELAAHFTGKTERGVKTVLARRKLSAKDYTPKTVSSED